MNPLVQPDPGLSSGRSCPFLRPGGAAREIRVAAAARGARTPRATIARSLEDAERARAELERLQQKSREDPGEARVEAESIAAEPVGRRARCARSCARRRAPRPPASCKKAERQIQLETTRAIAADSP